MVTTVRIPIDIRLPKTASLAGNAFWDDLALTNMEQGAWHFVKSVDGKVYGEVAVPNNVNATPNAKIILVVAANATTGNAVWNVNTSTINDNGGQEDVSFTAGTPQTITMPGTAYLNKEISFSPGDTFTAKYITKVEVYHNGASGSETLAVDSYLLRAFLEIDVN